MINFDGEVYQEKVAAAMEYLLEKEAGFGTALKAVGMGLGGAAVGGAMGAVSGNNTNLNNPDLSDEQKNSNLVTKTIGGAAAGAVAGSMIPKIKPAVSGAAAAFKNSGIGSKIMGGIGKITSKLASEQIDELYRSAAFDIPTKEEAEGENSVTPNDLHEERDINNKAEQYKRS